MLPAVAITFIINIATSFLKKVAFPRVGKVGVHIILFICAMIGAAYYTYLQHIASFKIVVENALALFAMAITLYEVILGYFPIFDSKTAQPEL